MSADQSKALAKAALSVGVPIPADPADNRNFAEKLADLINEHLGKDMSADAIICELEVHCMSLDDIVRAESASADK